MLMAFEGDVQEISLPVILQSLESNTKTGVLRVFPRDDDPKEWIIAIQDGKIAGIERPGGLSLEIHEVLVKWGYLDPEQAEKAFKKWRRAKKKTLGRILEEMGYLDRKSYSAVVSRIVQEEMLECLERKDASFSFTEGEPEWEEFDPEQVWAGVSIQPGPLILESARREDEWERINANIASVNEIFLPTTQADDIPEEDIKAEVYGLVREGLDVEGILEALPYSRFEVLKALSDLVEEGLARPASPPELKELAMQELEAGRLDKAEIILRSALEFNRHDPRLRITLANILEARGDLSQAAEEYAIASNHMYERGEIEDAMEFLAKAIGLKGSDPSLKARMLKLMLEHGDWDAIRREGIELARLYLSLGLGEESRKLLKYLLNRKELKNDRSILRELAEAETLSGNTKEAINVLSRLAELEKRDGNLKQAMDCYVRILSIDPGNEEAEKAFALLSQGLKKKKLERRKRMALVAGFSFLGSIFFIWAMHETVARVLLLKAARNAVGEAVWGRPAVVAPELMGIEISHPLTFAGREARKFSEYLIRLQMKRTIGYLEEKEFGKAAYSLTLLKINGNGIIKREEWWFLLGELIQGISLNVINEKEKVYILRAFKTIAGIEKKSLSEWRLWWNRFGSQFAEPSR